MRYLQFYAIIRLFFKDIAQGLILILIDLILILIYKKYFTLDGSDETLLEASFPLSH